MVEELSSKRFRELALECQEDARKTHHAEIRERYMYMAEQWLKLADEHDEFYGKRGSNGLGT
jgi:hypothetical protein